MCLFNSVCMYIKSLICIYLIIVPKLNALHTVAIQNLLNESVYILYTEMEGKAQFSHLRALKVVSPRGGGGGGGLTALTNSMLQVSSSTLIGF